MTEKFGILLIFTPLSFKGSEGKNRIPMKPLKTGFSKHFTDIYRVLKWLNSLYYTLVQGVAIAQSLQGFAYGMGFYEIDFYQKY